MIQFDEEDFKKWGIFRKSKRITLSPKEFDMVCQLHALWKRHNYYKPYTCNPRVIKNWITDLNTIWKNGVARD